LNEDIIVGLIHENLNLHPLALAEEIKTANDGDVLGYYAPAFDDDLSEQTAKSDEVILEEMKLSPDYKFIIPTIIRTIAATSNGIANGEDGRAGGV